MFRRLVLLEIRVNILFECSRLANPYFQSGAFVLFLKLLHVLKNKAVLTVTSNMACNICILNRRSQSTVTCMYNSYIDTLFLTILWQYEVIDKKVYRHWIWKADLALKYEMKSPCKGLVLFHCHYLEHTGLVIWRHFLFETKCHRYVTHFPFDRLRIR